MMIPINNSDTAWLIVSDYNQDNDLFHEDLREDILNPEISDWRYEYRNDNHVGGIHEGRWVGSDVIGGREVGNNQSWQVGCRFDSEIGVYPSHLVGGHTY